MKTKELIAALQEEDPSGELQVVCEGSPIYFAERQPAYYDGSLHVPVQDPECKHWNIIGWKVTVEGQKVRLHTVSLENALEMNPELPVEDPAEQLGNWLERAREEARKDEEECRKARENKTG